MMKLTKKQKLIKKLYNTNDEKRYRKMIEDFSVCYDIYDSIPYENVVEQMNLMKSIENMTRTKLNSDFELVSDVMNCILYPNEFKVEDIS